MFRPCSTVSSPVLTTPTALSAGSTSASARQQTGGADTTAEHGDHGRPPVASVVYSPASAAAQSSQRNSCQRRSPASISRSRAGLVGERPGQVGGERVHVAGRREQRRVAGDLRDRPGVAGHDGHAQLHRVEQREAEPLVERRVGEHGCVAEQPRPARGVHPPGQQHPRRGRGADRVDGGVDRRSVVAVGAGEHEVDVVVLGGERTERVARARGGSCAVRGCRWRARTGVRRARRSGASPAR